MCRKRILLIRNTGAKLNEILSMDPFLDIDLKQSVVVLNRQQDKEDTHQREVPISEQLATEVQSFLNDSEFAESVRGKFAVDPAFVRRKFYERAAACGFDKKMGAPEMKRLTKLHMEKETNRKTAFPWNCKNYFQ